MSDIADRLLNEWAEFRAQNDRRLAEIARNGEASAETRAIVDRLNDSISKLEARLEAAETAIARPPMPKGSGSGADAKLRALAFEANLRGRWATTEMRNAAMQIAAGEGTDLVPVEYATDIITGLQEQSYFRAIGARVIPLNSLTMNIPTLTNSTAAILTAEEAGVSEVEPTTSSITATAFRYTKLVKASRELVMDSRFALWSTILAPDFAQAFAKAENAAFTVGVGTTAPKGVVVGGTAAVTSASATAITADEVIDLYHALDWRHRASPSCRWMAADATIKLIRKLKDGDGQYLWAPGMQAGQPDRLLAQPVVTNSSMPAPTAGLKSLAIGDFGYYWIFEREAFTVQNLNELYAANGQIGYLAEKRFDGQPMLATAFQYLTMHA